MAGSLILATLTAKAQRTVQSRHIGWLWNGPPPTPAETDRYTNHLRALGWTEGQNLVIERRYANGDDTQLPGLVQQLIQLKVELIVAEGTVVALMAKRATGSIPIVVARSGDPVRAGLVTNLARPDSNVTGTSIMSPEIDFKRLQLLRELLPAVRRVGELVVLANPLDRLASAARPDGVLDGIQLIYFPVARASDLDDAVSEAARRGAQALHVSAEPLLGENFRQILKTAQHHSLPLLVDNSGALEIGGLMSYGPDQEELNRQLAYYVDAILRGAKPSDLPIQQPRKFEFGINSRAGKALGIAIPRSLLLRADKVIE